MSLFPTDSPRQQHSETSRVLPSPSERELLPRLPDLLPSPPGTFGFPPFYITRGVNSPGGSDKPSYSLQASSVRLNMRRVLRALQVKKAVLLEGSPGVGKTSLVTALAALSGHRLVRINLSDQTGTAIAMLGPHNVSPFSLLSLRVNQ